MRFELLSVGTSTVAPRIASGIVIGTSTSRLSPRRGVPCLIEGDGDLGLEVAPALGAARAASARAGTPRGAAEEVGEDVADPAEAARGAAAGPERAGVEAEEPAARVVLLALLRV